GPLPRYLTTNRYLPSFGLAQASSCTYVTPPTGWPSLVGAENRHCWTSAVIACRIAGDSESSGVTATTAPLLSTSTSACVGNTTRRLALSPALTITGSAIAISATSARNRVIAT